MLLAEAGLFLLSQWNEKLKRHIITQEMPRLSLTVKSSQPSTDTMRPLEICRVWKSTDNNLWLSSWWSVMTRPNGT